MDRWRGVLNVPLHPNARNCYRVAASLCISSSTKTLAVPCANAILFNGDRVRGTGNPVIDRLSDLQTLAQVLVSKFGTCVNGWVVEASVFTGPFAVYQDFIPSVNHCGEPQSYSSLGFPASSSTVLLLSNCLRQVENHIFTNRRELCSSSSSISDFREPRTIVLGFSKGGTVVNQLVTELSFLDVNSMESSSTSTEHPTGSDIHIIPATENSLLNSISEIHYVDVGLNSAGAYLTDRCVIERISKRLIHGANAIRFVLHGTPRQWCDKQRHWIRDEKDELMHLLKAEAEKSGGKLQVCERLYLADRPPDMQMHFEIIEHMDIT